MLAISNKTFREYILITLGVALMAVGIVVFYSPNSLVTGGVGGLSIIIYEVSERMLGFSVPLWVTNFVLNTPIFVVAIKRFGFAKMAKTIYATAVFTFMLFLSVFIPDFAPDDMVLVVIYGGVICGVGLSLVFRCMATTGGTDTLASLINLRFRHISISRIMFLLDALVILVGLLTFDIERTMYAIITVFVVVKTIDSLLEGLDFAKAAFIITSHGDSLSQKIFSDINRGVTRLQGEGMYSKKGKDVLLCIVSNKQIVYLKELTHTVDKEAFVIIANVREVLGQGFKSSP